MSKDDYIAATTGRRVTPWGAVGAKSVEQRLRDVEAVAHAPVAFLTCNRCHCAVIEESWDGHSRWHTRMDEAT